MGGWSTRAWAGSLRKSSLRPTGLPVVDKPQSVVMVGAAESLRREKWAYQLSDVQVLARDLASQGYKRIGPPLGVDGVRGYASEGGRGVALSFSKSGGDKPERVIEVRWWDEDKRCPVKNMPDIYYTETFLGGPGESSVVRFRYVDDQGNVASQEEVVNPLLACENIDCHTNPPGHCHDECDACLHCLVPTNVCRGVDEGCEDYCEACGLCVLTVHPGVRAMCGVICAAYCSQGCGYTYCCDYRNMACCWNPTGGLPVPYCVNILA